MAGRDNFGFQIKVGRLMGKAQSTAQEILRYHSGRGRVQHSTPGEQGHGQGGNALLLDSLLDLDAYDIWKMIPQGIKDSLVMYASEYPSQLSNALNPAWVVEAIQRFNSSLAEYFAGDSSVSDWLYSVFRGIRSRLASAVIGTYLGSISPDMIYSMAENDVDADVVWGTIPQGIKDFLAMYAEEYTDQLSNDVDSDWVTDIIYDFDPSLARYLDISGRGWLDGVIEGIESELGIA